MSHGIVVDHKTAGVRYAVSSKNFNPTIHTKVRELKPNETVIGFQPKKVEKDKTAQELANPISSRKD